MVCRGEKRRGRAELLRDKTGRDALRCNPLRSRDRLVMPGEKQQEQQSWIQPAIPRSAPTTVSKQRRQHSTSKCKRGRSSPLSAMAKQPIFIYHTACVSSIATPLPPPRPRTPLPSPCLLPLPPTYLRAAHGASSRELTHSKNEVSHLCCCPKVDFKKIEHKKINIKKNI